MNYRSFGKTDLKVSEIGFGCNKIGNSLFSTSSTKENIKLLKTAHNLGITFYDLAPTYSYGEAETILGKAFESNRQEIIICTKGGRLPSSLAKYGKVLKSAKSIISPLITPFKTKLKKISNARFDFSDSKIKSSIEESLKRLKTDYIDLFMLHNPSLEIIKEGKIFETLNTLKKEGKIRYYGLSIDTLEEAIAALQYPIDGLQITFNLIQEKMAYDLMEYLGTKAKIGLIVKTPFLRGLLTPKHLLQEEYFNKEMLQKINNKFKDLSPLFKSRKPNQLALQYILNHLKISSALCGTTSIEHLKQNLKYEQSEPLSSQDWELINKLRDKYVI